MSAVIGGTGRSCNHALRNRFGVRDGISGDTILNPASIQYCVPGIPHGLERTVRCAASAGAKRHVAALFGARKDAQV